MTTEAKRKGNSGGGWRREKDVRWKVDEWEDLARCTARLMGKKENYDRTLGELLFSAQQQAIQSTRQKPLSELNSSHISTKFYAMAKAAGVNLLYRPSRIAGMKPKGELTILTERQWLLMIRRIDYLQSIDPGRSTTEYLDRAQALELPPELRRPRRRLHGTAGTYVKRSQELRPNLWLLDNVPFIPNAKTYDEAQGLVPPPAAPAAVPVVADLPPVPPPPVIAPASPVPAHPASVDRLSGSIAEALNSYIAERDAAITAHVIRSITEGPVANAIAAHITQSLAGSIAEAVNAVIASVVPAIVAQELQSGVRHVTQVTGLIAEPAITPDAPERVEPRPVVPKHDPSPPSAPSVGRMLKVDLVGAQRKMLQSVKKQLNGSGRFVELHYVDQDNGAWHPQKHSTVVVFEGLTSHKMVDRIKASGCEWKFAGRGANAAANAIKTFLKERGLIGA